MKEIHLLVKPRCWKCPLKLSEHRLSLSVGGKVRDRRRSSSEPQRCNPWMCVCVRARVSALPNHSAVNSAPLMQSCTLQLLYCHSEFINAGQADFTLSCQSSCRVSREAGGAVAVSVKCFPETLWEHFNYFNSHFYSGGEKKAPIFWFFFFSCIAFVSVSLFQPQFTAR